MTESTPLSSKQRQSQATQKRLLEAAFEEFQLHGLAGARVDRIAERAKSNKRLIYIYFGNKEQLFDAVVQRSLEKMIDAHAAAFPDDLPGYAVELFDYLEERPEVFRLFWWRHLERRDTSDVEQANYRDKVARIAEAQRAGRLDAKIPAAHLFAFLLGVVQSWSLASDALRDAAGEDAARDRRRESVREAVARVTGTTGTSMG
jgi:AcrR family transcriptional regulator